MVKRRNFTERGGWVIVYLIVAVVAVVGYACYRAWVHSP